MTFTVRKVFKSVVWATMACALVACSGEAPVRTAEYAVQGVYSAALSPKGDRALIGSIQHGGSFWNATTHDRRFNWNHAAGEFTPLVSVDIDPTATYAVTGGARTMVLWNATTGQSEGFWNTPGDIRAIKLNRNGNFALVGLDDQTARYFDVKNGGIKQTFRTGAVVRSVALDDDGRLALTGDDRYHVTLWDTATGEMKQQWRLDNRLATVALSDDGQFAFGAAQLGQAKVWSTATGQELLQIDTGKLANRKITLSQAVFSSDNRQLLVGGINREVRLINLRDGQVSGKWSLHLKDTLRPTGASVMALAFGNGNRYYAIGSNGVLNTLE